MKPHPLITLGCVLAACLIVWHLSTVTSSLTMYPDTAQLSRAVPYLLSGQGFLTSIGWFEAQLLTPLPAPQTVWPPGYALLTAAVMAISGAESIPGVMIAIAFASFLLTGLLIYLCLREVEIGANASALVATSWLCLVPVWLDVIEIRSEPLFSAFIMLAMFAVLRFGQRPSGAWGWYLVAALATTGGILVRYQGIVMTGPLFLAIAIAFFSQRPSARWQSLYWSAAACVPASLVTALLFLRNLPLTGSMTGAATVGSATRSFADLAKATDWAPDRFKLVIVSLMTTVAVLLVLVAVFLFVQSALIRKRGNAISAADPGAVAICFGFAAMGFTILLIVAMGMESTSYRIDVRYFSPAAPSLIVALGAIVYRVFAGRIRLPPAAGTGAAILLLLVVAIQGVFFYPTLEGFVDRLPTPRLKVMLANEHVSGTSLLDLIHSGSLSRRVLMSNRAQEISVITPAILVGISGPIFNRRTWDAPAIRDLAHLQNVDYLLLFRQPSGSALDFLASAIVTSSCCDWLKVEYTSPELILARVVPRTKR